MIMESFERPRKIKFKLYERKGKRIVWFESPVSEDVKEKLSREHTGIGFDGVTYHELGGDSLFEGEFEI